MLILQRVCECSQYLHFQVSFLSFDADDTALRWKMFSAAETEKGRADFIKYKLQVGFFCMISKHIYGHKFTIDKKQNYTKEEFVTLNLKMSVQI